MLPSDIDPGKSEAKYADGVLELVLPKKDGAVAAQVTVK
jgi:HSP20 family molecular chaperone IbpA